MAAIVDFAVGDPWNWPHPVRFMGWAIDGYRRVALRYLQSPGVLKLAGIGLTLLLVVGSGAIALGLIYLADRVHPGLGLVVQVGLLASCFAGRSLRDAAEEVLLPLAQGDLERARSCLSRYVGRDTEQLSEAEVLRAVLETVAENGVDGVMAPLFWAIVGSFTGLGAVPVAIGFKAASTLDSMVGYREAPYTDLGWCSAKTDDVLTWLPCRLTVLTLGLLAGRPREVWMQCAKDGRQDPSPNSGWSECAYAAVLGVQLGGFNTYRGIPKLKPLLGEARRSITAAVVRQALGLNRACFLSWLSLACAGLIWGAWGR